MEAGYNSGVWILLNLFVFEDDRAIVVTPTEDVKIKIGFVGSREIKSTFKPITQSLYAGVEGVAINSL